MSHPVSYSHLTVDSWFSTRLRPPIQPQLFSSIWLLCFMQTTTLSIFSLVYSPLLFYIPISWLLSTLSLSLSLLILPSADSVLFNIWWDFVHKSTSSGPFCCTWMIVLIFKILWVLTCHFLFLALDEGHFWPNIWHTLSGHVKQRLVIITVVRPTWCSYCICGQTSIIYTFSLKWFHSPVLSASLLPWFTCPDRRCVCVEVAHPVTLRASWGIDHRQSSSHCGILPEMLN